MRLRGSCLVAVAAAWLGAPGALLAQAPGDLVLALRGELPIVITAPHGGREPIPGVAPRGTGSAAARDASRRWGGVVVTADGGTDVIARKLADEIRRLTGRAPYLVVARFHRKYLDANRPAALAMDDPAAQPYFDRYHRAVREFVDEIRRGHPAGLLLDVHGQARLPDALARGTQNGRTVIKLYRRAGTSAITGPEGLFGLLEAQGFRVAPANKDPVGSVPEPRGLEGGYTVQTYGSDNADGIDAVQLEFGTEYRRTDRLARTAAEAARAVVAFHAAYLTDAMGAGKARR